MATESTVKRQPPRARLLTAAAGGKAVVGEASKPIEREKNLFPNLKGGKLYTSSSKIPVHESQVKLHKTCSRKPGRQGLHSSGQLLNCSVAEQEGQNRSKNRTSEAFVHVA